MKKEMPWAANVRKVTPYIPGEQPNAADMIKLNTNENPYSPSPKVFEAHKNTEVSRFSLYPELGAGSLVKSLAKYHGIAENEVFAGVGSDDVLSLAFLTFFNSEKPILFPDITYSFYPVWAEVYHIPFACPALRKDFTIEVEDYKKENGGVVIANPNAPTSIGMSAKKIEEIIQANPNVVVIIDEAYVDFGGETVLPLIHKYDNLLVVRTYSKSRSMAGMRIGYAMGNAALIQAMNDVKESINSYTINTESILLGIASLEDEEYFQENLKKVVATRNRTKKELEKLGFDVKESQTNFLFASHESVPAKEIFAKLKEKNIYVRYFDKEKINEYLRITIGTDAQMERFLQAVREIVK
jgi:histidinol-phosphate aminotransferase